MQPAGVSKSLTRSVLPKSDIVKSQFATSLEGGDGSANKRRNQAGWCRQTGD